jgi:HD-GYP domain-containing protein (c-di-GMP phosphodiesterase class II)
MPEALLGAASRAPFAGPENTGILAGYPDRERVLEAAAKAVCDYVERSDASAIDAFVRREMHAASTEQIAAIVDTICHSLLAGMRRRPDARTIRLFDLLRTHVSELMYDELWRQAYARHADAQIDALLLAVRMTDERLADHLEEVGQLAGWLAAAMQLSPERIDYVVGAGRLHAIGKLRVSRQILDKPGPLSQTELAEVQRQRLLAEEDLRSLPGLERYAPALRAPEGHGPVPLEMRIVCVADAYVALTSPRCYRPQPYERAEAIELLRRDRRCDPAVVAQLERLVASAPTRAA